MTTSTLETLRRLKTRHQRLLSQVSTVREELEDYLKDDDDMAKMCLTRKRDQTQAWASAQRAISTAPPNEAKFSEGKYGSVKSAKHAKGGLSVALVGSRPDRCCGQKSDCLP